MNDNQIDKEAHLSIIKSAVPKTMTNTDVAINATIKIWGEALANTPMNDEIKQAELEELFYSSFELSGDQGKIANTLVRDLGTFIEIKPDNMYSLKIAEFFQLLISVSGMDNPEKKTAVIRSLRLLAEDHAAKLLGEPPLQP